MLNTVVIITDYNCQNWNINSGTGVGTGSAQSLESILYSLWAESHHSLPSYGLHSTTSPETTRQTPRIQDVLPGVQSFLLQDDTGMHLVNQVHMVSPQD